QLNWGKTTNTKQQFTYKQGDYIQPNHSFRQNNKHQTTIHLQTGRLHSTQPFIQAKQQTPNNHSPTKRSTAVQSNIQRKKCQTKQIATTTAPILQRKFFFSLSYIVI
ncbi:hypothetical protein Tsubulata_022996, partial [Turnera subulata]